MSSTNRGAVRKADEYYVTPVPEIVKFLKAWREDVHPVGWPEKILDPCCGGERTAAGDIITPPSYPTAFKMLDDWQPVVFTLDIRPDAVAQYGGDYLDPKGLVGHGGFDAIVFNPPFSLAMSFIEKALREVRGNGFVVALLRLNFLGSEKRNGFLRYHMPTWIYVHSRRMSFTSDGKTDSIEYAHFVWQKQPCSKSARLRVLEY